MPGAPMPGNGLLAEWDLGESQWKAGMDSNLRFLSACVQMVLENVDGSIPAGPVEGMIRYSPGSKEVLAYRDSKWVRVASGKEGWLAFDKKTGKIVLFGENGTPAQAWMDDAPKDGHRYVRMNELWQRDSYKINAFIPMATNSGQTLAAFIIPAPMTLLKSNPGIARCEVGTSTEFILDLFVGDTKFGTVTYAPNSKNGAVSITGSNNISFAMYSELLIKAPSPLGGTPEGMKLLFQLEM